MMASSNQSDLPAFFCLWKVILEILSNPVYDKPEFVRCSSPKDGFS